MSWYRTPPRPAKVWTGDTLPTPRAAPAEVVVTTAQMVVPLPKGIKAKPGKRTPTKVEAEWMRAIVAYGCIACRLDGHGVVAPAVHHMLRGGRRIGHLFTLPLCDPGHHQNGAALGLLSRHPWKAQFEAKYGSEAFLLDLLRAALKVKS